MPLVSILNNPIEYLKGVGPLRADLLKKEAGLFTFNDLLHYFPFRHIDRTKFTRIADLRLEGEYVLVSGQIISVEEVGDKRSRRLVAILADGTGQMELVWFQGINWVNKQLHIGTPLRVFGKVGFFMNSPQMAHPEFEMITPGNAAAKNHLEPIYPSTEKLKSRQLGGRHIARLTQALLEIITQNDLPENLPPSLINKFQLIGRFKAYNDIHFPKTHLEWQHAVKRLKFEELFISQLRLGLVRFRRNHFSKGFVFKMAGDFLNEFYHNHLPFELTGAQKKVLKEIRKDLGSGKQMNRLLQGDVGSGKTMVALLAMLIAAGNGFQSCFMAPTEILARQHYESLKQLLGNLKINVGIITGSSSAKDKRETLSRLADGTLHLITGTHALIEETVQFNNLGLAIIDEQHRFGVEQRAKLWKKDTLAPHILVMTATPIPRTLALTAYGDLEYSIMDEMPAGRISITTVHRMEYKRPEVMNFIRSEIDKGRQAYVIFPLIEESAKLDFENLMKGYENVKAYFPEPKFYISMVHGKQKPALKKTNMDRFVTGDTQIMVSTTVIEVGVNVPNASVMVIENAEKFGLTQLHQLRGRVGRGNEKSYCILMTKVQMSEEAKARIKIMCETNDGFKIAEKDLEIRGPGDIEGTRQSGEQNFKLANIIEDRHILEIARNEAEAIIEKDSTLDLPEHQGLKQFLQSSGKGNAWSKIS